MRKPKPGELKVEWSKKERDIQFDWGEGIGKPDGHLMYSALCATNTTTGQTLVKELEARGYDLTTLKFSIKKKP